MDFRFRRTDKNKCFGAVYVPKRTKVLPQTSKLCRYCWPDMNCFAADTEGETQMMVVKEQEGPVSAASSTSEVLSPVMQQETISIKSAHWFGCFILCSCVQKKKKKKDLSRLDNFFQIALLDGKNV